MQIKVAFIFGTRPEAIKLAPVINLFKKQSNFITETCFTGQHKEMVEQVLPIFDIVPDVKLDLMTEGQPLAYFTGRALQKISNYIERSEPTHIFVQGDTATVLAGALAGFLNRKKVYHVEAGLRTGDNWSPFPEEINRVLTGRIADYHFPPTRRAKANLISEGIGEDRIAITGNTGIDALLFVQRKLKKGELSPTVSEKIKGIIKKSEGNLVLVTAHRRESFGAGFVNICSAIRELALRHSAYQFLYPVHLNPKVQEPVNEYLNDIPNVHLCEPLNYLNFAYVMGEARLILTDSGGIQEEAPSLNKPLVVMRDNTERPEGIEAGCAKLVGTDKELIVDTVTKILTEERIYQSMANVENPYGTGNASELILNFFSNNL